MTLKTVDKPANIEISYKHLNSHAAFRKALQTIFRSNTLPMKTAYWVGRILKDLEKELEKIGLEYQVLVTEYAEKDAEGNLIPAARPGAVNIAKEKEAEFAEKQKEFESRTLKLDYAKLKATDFERTNLSGEDLQALEPLLYGLES